MDRTSDPPRDVARRVAPIAALVPTTADIERDIALTRERVSDALVALEHKVHPKRVLDEHPLAAVALAFAAGVALGVRRPAHSTSFAPAARSPGILHSLAEQLATSVASAATARLFHGSGRGGA